VRLPTSGTHLQRLRQKFRLDHAASAGFEIEKIRAGAALAPDSFEHIIDLHEQVWVLTGFAPYLLREGDEFLPARTDDRARASQGLEFPELCPTMIVAAIRINRSHERTLLAFGPQPRIDPRQISLGARLRHRRQE